MKQYASALLVAAFLFGTSFLAAQGRGAMQGPRMPQRGLMKVMADLKLTDEQKKEVEKLHTDLAKQQVTQGAKMATARIEMRELLRADNPDKSAIEKKMNEISQLGVQMHMQRLNQWFAVNKLLNADQQKVWKHALENAGAGRGMERGQMMRRAPMMNRRHMEMMQQMHPAMPKSDKEDDD